MLWYHSRAEDDCKDLVWNIAPDATRTLLVTTDGLGAGVALIPFRTVISSCDSNRKIGAGTMGVVRNSQENVKQEGGRVARDAKLGPGRHIRLRQERVLPLAHVPEIQVCALSKTVLRLVRDWAWDGLTADSWLAGEDHPALTGRDTAETLGEPQDGSP